MALTFGFQLDGLPICINYWDADDCERPDFRFYFLTCAHDYAMVGLNSFWNYPIFCSSITAKIANFRIELSPDSFTFLEIGETVTICCNHIDGFEGKCFEVTALNSAHCPGSTMFLFDGWFGRILVTGGYRFEFEDQFDMALLKEKPIDRLYLDIKSWGNDMEPIPSRLRSTVRALQEIAQRPDKESVLIVVPETVVGQEQLLVRIVENFEEPIAVSKIRMEVLRRLMPQADNFFTDDVNCARIRVISGTKAYVIRIFKDMCSTRWTSIIVLATPDCLRLWDEIIQSVGGTYYQLRNSITIIPYSDYSTIKEMQDFLSQLTIRRLIPIGNALKQEDIEELETRFQIIPIGDAQGSLDESDAGTQMVNIDSQMGISPKSVVSNSPARQSNWSMEPLEPESPTSSRWDELNEITSARSDIDKDVDEEKMDVEEVPPEFLSNEHNEILTKMELDSLSDFLRKHFG